MSFEPRLGRFGKAKNGEPTLAGEVPVANSKKPVRGSNIRALLASHEWLYSGEYSQRTPLLSLRQSLSIET